MAEQRKHEIARFLESLFLSQLARESDLVYTFFHPLLRDQQDADIHLRKLKEGNKDRKSGSDRTQKSVGTIKGQLKLSIGKYPYFLDSWFKDPRKYL